MSEPEYRPPAQLIPADDASPPQSAPRRTTQGRLRRKHLRLALVLGSLLILGFAALIFARPIYLKTKAWRSRSFARESARLLDEKQIDAALGKAHTAYLLDGLQPETLRAYAKALAAKNEYGNALVLWKRLISSGHATFEDRRATIDMALKCNGLATAEAQLFQLFDFNEHGSETCILSARLKLARGDMAGARLELRQALNLQPSNEAAQLLLGRLLLRDDEASHKNGEKRLRALGESPTENGLGALRVLSNDPRASIQCTEWVATALPNHPLATDIDRVTAIGLSLSCHPNQRKSLLDEAEAKYSAADPELVTAFGRLLLSVKEPRRFLTFLSEERVLTRRDWILIRLDALAMLSRFVDALDLLEKAESAMPSLPFLLYHAWCLDQLGRADEAREFWNKAQEFAGSDPAMLTQLINYSAAVGASEQAEKARRRLAPFLEAAPKAQPVPVKNGR